MTLYLLPNLLAEEGDLALLPAHLAETVTSLQGLIAESEKGGRAYLKRITGDVRMMPISVLSEHTTRDEMDELMKPLIKGELWGVISDGGLPCLADPGSELVARAQKRGIPVQALVGPSSIILALQLSGMGAQRFAFHGYLPRPLDELKTTILNLEQRSRREKAVQLFIEAPYRNMRLLEALLGALNPNMQLAIACDLTAPTQSVIIKPVSKWRADPLPELNDRPAVFLISSSS